MGTGPKKIENRGGARIGSGRKSKYALTEIAIDNMLKAAKRWAKEKGKTLDDVLLDIIYDTENEPRVRMGGIKIYKEFTMAKSSEQNINHKNMDGPKIGLPEMKPDPAKIIQIKGGKG